MGYQDQLENEKQSKKTLKAELKAKTDLLTKERKKCSAKVESLECEVISLKNDLKLSRKKVQFVEEGSKSGGKNEKLLGPEKTALEKQVKELQEKLRQQSGKIS